MLVVKPPILIDIDEVLFPFADAYSRWLALTQGLDFEPNQMKTYDVAGSVGPRHSSLAVQFVNDPAVVRGEQALATAVRNMPTRSSDFHLVACTRRFEILEGVATREWMALNFAAIEQVIFTRTSPGASEAPKSALARQIGAVALIDDSLSNMTGLDASCRPCLLRRPPGLPSDAGAEPWHDVVADLKGLLK